MDTRSILKKITALIVDDEENAQSLMQILLNRYCPEIDIIGSASDIHSAYEKINSLQPDVVFLDITMPPHDSFELLRLFKRIPFQIIFCTAHSEYAIQAIRFAALDYLLKPIKADELKLAVQRLIERKEQESPSQYQLLAEQIHKNEAPQKLFIHSIHTHQIIEVKDIIYLEAAGNYTDFYLLNNKKVTSSKQLGEYEDLLSLHKFYRTHKSFLVNLHHVVSISKTDGAIVNLQEGHQCPIAIRRVEQFMQTIQGLGLH
jgi:two-component system LytT family response regulator